MSYRVLWWKLWLTALGTLLPIMALNWLTDLWDGGFSWSNVYEDPLVWVFLGLFWAVCGCFFLWLRARRAGVPVGADVLADEQVYAWSPAGGVGDWEGVRARLDAAKRSRAVAVADDGDRIEFGWRTISRSRWAASASVSRDGTSGRLRVEVRASEEMRLGIAGLPKGSAFVALCQIVRLIGRAATAEGTTGKTGKTL